MQLGVTWSKRVSIHRGIYSGGGNRIKAAGGKFKYRADLLPCEVELLDDFPLRWLRLRGFRRPRTRASGYRETPMRRLVSPARFPPQGTATSQVLP
jgi:hypothetical protein